MTSNLVISNKHLKVFLDDVLKISITTIGPSVLKNLFNGKTINTEIELDTFIWLVIAISLYHIININFLQ